ncbi:MAG: hypothetical protein NTW86_10895 [Candidatus Sumerlaeota bacterium]|nr:hypothetical protein [Candidatus Sumerlaeota bacterium]
MSDPGKSGLTWRDHLRAFVNGAWEETKNWVPATSFADGYVRSLYQRAEAIDAEDMRKMGESLLRAKIESVRELVEAESEETRQKLAVATVAFFQALAQCGFQIKALGERVPALELLREKVERALACPSQMQIQHAPFQSPQLQAGQMNVTINYPGQRGPGQGPQRPLG